MVKSNDLAPICLFTFNRLKETKLCVASLRDNYLASESELIIFSDGPKNQVQQIKVEEVRNYLYTIEGFKKVTIITSEENKGLAKSIIDGVSKVLLTNPVVIVLEDDLVTTPNFLNFMNQALTFFQSDKKVISISGFTLPLPSLKNARQDYYFGVRASSWGWGVWRDRWEEIDWEMRSYESFINNKKFKNLFKLGGSDMVRMLKNQKNGKISSWAIRFCFHQFNHSLVTVFPSKSKLYSVGFSSDATHTKYTSRFDTIKDESGQKYFHFNSFRDLEPEKLREFRSFFSLKRRLIDKINSIIR